MKVKVFDEKLEEYNTTFFQESVEEYNPQNNQTSER